MPRNIELKVPFDLTDARRKTLERLRAHAAASLRQIDTYFHCREGRLKLREIVEQTSDGRSRKAVELIAYRRADETGFRGSDYIVSPIDDAESIKAALSIALGVRVVVRKRRELLLWENVRIHLDEVEGLGLFLEFEAVLDVSAPDRAAEEAVSHERLRVLCTELQIDAVDTIAGSYSDMMD